MIKLLLKPYDVLLFRDGKPFIARENHLAKSILLSHQAIAGAIRSLLYLHNKSFADCIGLGKDEPKFEIVGSFITNKNGEELFMLPMNTIIEEGRAVPLFPKEYNGRLFIPPLGKYERAFVNYDSLLKLFNGKSIEVPKEGGEILERERRIGIKLANTRTTESGYLYSVEFLRIEGISVIINPKECEEIVDVLKEAKYIKLGGESRFAKIKVMENIPNFVREEEISSKKLLFYVATPIVLNSRGFDGIRDEIQRKFNLSILHHLFITGRPQVISGWDMRKNKPKGTKFLIPAGSVIFLELEDKASIKNRIKVGKLVRLGHGLIFGGFGNDESPG